MKEGEHASDASRDNAEQQEAVETKVRNPNSIGELLSISKDLPTSPDKVYRSVRDRAAIDDLDASGVVRNRHTSVGTESPRWGDKVFWSQGQRVSFITCHKEGM